MSYRHHGPCNLRLEQRGYGLWALQCSDSSHACVFPGRWSKSLPGCGASTGSAPARHTVGLFPQQDSGHKGPCFPVACALWGPRCCSHSNVSGHLGNWLQKCPSVYFSFSPGAKQMAFSAWKYNNAIQTHTPFPFHCGVDNGSCLLLRVTYRGGTGHTTQRITTATRPMFITASMAVNNQSSFTF